MNTSVNVHVSPITSPRSGEAVRNQYCIEGPGYTAFQSYNSLIAVYQDGQLVLGCHWNYSVTTAKYLWQWLRENCWRVIRELPDGRTGAERIRKAIEAGLIIYNPEMV